jgi:hypothetical protein
MISVDMNAFRISREQAEQWLTAQLHPKGHSHEYAVVLLGVQSGHAHELHAFEAPCSTAGSERAHLATVIAALRDTADEMEAAYADILTDPPAASTSDEHTDECAPCPPDVLRNLLLLVGVTVSEDQVDSWTLEERAEVERWASAVHLDASDNEVQVPPRPAVLDTTAPDPW